MEEVDSSKMLVPVKLFGWDLKNLPKLVQKVFKGWNKVIDDSTPRKIIHVGVCVHKRFYHFNRNGIQIHYEIPNKAKIQLIPDPINHQEDCKDKQVFSTKKSITELDRWIEENRMKFSSQNYCAADHNCIDFAKALMEFLEVPFEDGLHKELHDWLKKNGLIPQILKSENFKKFSKFFGLGLANRTQVDSVQEVSDVVGDGDEEDEDLDALLEWEAL